MSRYIDADKYLEKAQYEAQSMPQNCGFAEYTDWLIGKTPSIDIVFCKECKYYEAKEEWCYWRDEAITADDFCSYGKRREP